MDPSVFQGKDLSCLRKLLMLLAMLVALGLWRCHSSLCLCLPMASSHVYPLLFSYKDTVIGLGSTWIMQDDLISNSLMTSAKTFFQIRSH